MKKHQKNNNSESVWDTIIDVLKLILSFGILVFTIYLLVAPFLNNKFDDLYFMIALFIFYEIVNSVGEGVFS